MKHYSISQTASTHPELFLQRDELLLLGHDLLQLLDEAVLVVRDEAEVGLFLGGVQQHHDLDVRGGGGAEVDTTRLQGRGGGGEGVRQSG